MSKDYFENVPPELILVLAPSLSTTSLNALGQTCDRLHKMLQPELESRITPELAQDLLVWAAPSKPHIIAKFLAPPHFVPPNPPGVWKSPLHIAAEAGNLETTRLLLAAGADPAADWEQDWYQPLHLAAEKKHIDVIKLLLDNGAPVDSGYGSDGCRETALHHACAIGHLDMMKLLIERGANIENQGHFGTALGFAVHYHQREATKFLLDRGADVSVIVPLFILLEGGPPLPHEANLLYVVLDLRHPSSLRYPRRVRGGTSGPTKWEGLPLEQSQRELMTLLLAHGASKDKTMQTILRHVGALAKEAECTEEEYLDIIAAMFKEAEDAIPDVR
ncbi:ankyrin repeat-containing domain protein [Mycena metata]|uniref:Ankyrin repeat-containing domain protein n=1 Tax=Mycena metata TaxID=1033252 RepID=A0AAD7MR04_9AGAR|nr:ankyrin repeat-containing domain protein [Mycena metata]